MFCGEPEGLMEQEGNYLAALESAAHYKITGSTLEMTNADGMQILTFTAAAEEKS
jgi:heat shock protein HslJ